MVKRQRLFLIGRSHHSSQQPRSRLPSHPMTHNTITHCHHLNEVCICIPSLLTETTSHHLCVLYITDPMQLTSVVVKPRLLRPTPLPSICPPTPYFEEIGKIEHCHSRATVAVVADENNRKRDGQRMIRDDTKTSLPLRHEKSPRKVERKVRTK